MVNVVDPGGGGTGRPPLLATLIAAARKYGADVVVFVATAIRESNLTWDALGDFDANGQPTSFGPFQHHRGGALGNRSPAWAMSPAAVEERAQVFAAARAHTGADAAAIQRPRDPQKYAAAVNGYLDQARRLVADYDAAGTAAPASSSPSSSSGSGSGSGGILGTVGGVASGVGGAVVSGVGAAGGFLGGVASKGASAVGSLFDWDAARRLVLGALLVLGGVGLVVTGGYQATRS